MEVSPLDASYMPSSVIVYAGQTVGGLKEVKQCNVPSTAKEFPLITGLTEVGKKYSTQCILYMNIFV